MLEDLFSIRFRKRYSKLNLLGPIVDGFSDYLKEQGYPLPVVRKRIRAIPSIELRLTRRGCHRVSDITPAFLIACMPAPGRAHESPEISATARLLNKYFHHTDIFKSSPKNQIDKKMFEYSDYLQSVRGLASSTIVAHLATIRIFLDQVCPRGNLKFLKKLSAQDVETFVKISGQRVGRGSLQHIVAHIRSFLKNLSSCGEAPLGLEVQIDTPRVYREEKLPRALPWNTVRALLRSVDRSLAIGKRDYAILLLIATYGLRSSEITNLKLDDIDWRANVISIFQRKTGASLLLPLTGDVGKALLSYLKKGRPKIIVREIFVRHRAPSGTLKPAAISDIFQTWSQRSELDIPFQGAHCLRHSYAVHLLRQGTSVKTIGDIMGHRNPESTCLYLRLSVKDLRAVPLNLPLASRQVQK